MPSPHADGAASAPPRPEADVCDGAQSGARPTGRELRLLNAAVDLVHLLETGFGTTLSDSASVLKHELRSACESYVGKGLRQIPVKVVRP